MNKTVNINLAGLIFHIDEDAYAKLQRYLESIKRSFDNTQGRDEIISDIEARIAELFNEKIKNERQVISNKEVEEVIAIMGQPEDYVVDEEIFEDEPGRRHATTATGKVKKLFRDTENGYIGGVSSGLGHYLGIEAIWVRLLWVLLTILSSGGFILIYIAFWIFVPEAKTTADKLAMRGEEVTVSNIERKIREGFHDVSDRVKSVDYERYGSQAKKGASSAATSVGNFIRFFLKLIVKFIGVMLVLVAGTTLIGLFVGLFTVGTFGLVDWPWADYIEVVNTDAPIWLVSMLLFFLIGIPFFFLFVLGLKILVKNLKSIGRTLLLVLLGVWILSVIGLTIVGVSHATNRAFEEDVITTETLNIQPQDTLYIKMRGNEELYGRNFRTGDFEIKYDENDNKVIFGMDVDLIVRSTSDSIGKMEITKSAEGKNFKDAKARAAAINYSTSFVGNELLLDDYYTTATSNKFRDQEVMVRIFVPEGTVIMADENTRYYTSSSSYWDNILKGDQTGKYLKVMKDEAICEDCPEDTWEDEAEDEDNWEENDEDWDSSDDFNARINVNGEEMQIRVNDSGVQVNNESVKRIRLDSSGIEIEN